MKHTPRIKIDDPRKEVFVDGKPVRLAKKEYQILAALLDRKTWSRPQLLREVWGHTEEVDTRTVDQHLARLRRKVGPGLIETVTGFGYRLA